MAAGSISAEQFTECLEIFLQQCLLSHDRWELKTSVDGQKYLCKRQSVACGFPEHTDSADETTLPVEEQLEDINDSSSLQLESQQTVYTYEYHIVYSHSYAVPVLYFNAFKTDGRLLSLQEIWANIPRVYQDRLEDERWTFLTQQEHPLLGRPFYQLHPCHTSDLMKQTAAMGDNTRNYILTWLSAVAPVVGLHLPLSYGQHTSTDVP